MAEPHREKRVLCRYDIFRAAVFVANKHFNLDPYTCGGMMTLSLQEHCNQLRELWSPADILEKCEDVALNMDWCVEEVQKNFFDKEWLESVVKCCFCLF